MSETVGFVLVFGLITTTIAVTFTMGLGGLDAAQTAERDNNVERAFDVLHDNLQDISRDGVPSRATEIRLAGGQLSLVRRAGLDIVSEDQAVNGTNIGSRTLVYSGAGDTEIAYENGAVIRSDGDGSVMLNQPDLLIGGTTVISGIGLGTSSGTPEGVGGDRTVLVVGERTDRGAATVDSENVTLVHGDTNYPDAWARYYNGVADEADAVENANVTVEVEEETVRATFKADERIIIHETGINVALSD